MKKQYIVVIEKYGDPTTPLCNFGESGQPLRYTTESKVEAFQLARRLAKNHQYRYIVYEAVAVVEQERFADPEDVEHIYV